MEQAQLIAAKQKQGAHLVGKDATAGTLLKQVRALHKDYIERQEDGEVDGTFEVELIKAFPKADKQALADIGKFVQYEAVKRQKRDRRVMVEAKEAEILQLFGALDADSSFSISMPELLRATTAVGLNQAEMTALFHKVDTDESGTLDIEEFTEMVTERHDIFEKLDEIIAQRTQAINEDARMRQNWFTKNNRDSDSGSSPQPSRQRNRRPSLSVVVNPLAAALPAPGSTMAP